MIRVLILLTLGFLEAIAEKPAAQQPTELQGCPAPDMCGNITIPHPFGIKPGCYLAGFEVICDRTFNPPRAFLAGDPPLFGDKLPPNVNSSKPFTVTANFYYSGTDAGMPSEMVNYTRGPLELLDISVNQSKLRVYAAINSDCSTNETHHILFEQSIKLQPSGPFTLSANDNSLVGVGQNVIAMFADSYAGEEYSTICLSFLSSVSKARNGPCENATGLGCCQQTLPPGVNTTLVRFQHRNNSKWRTYPCSYAMLVEKSWYNFSTEDLFEYPAFPNKYPRGVLPDKYPTGVPLVLDFAIRNGSCPQENRGPPGKDYACVSGNSSCLDAGKGRGYKCECKEGYNGNPYMPNGCQDIDECALPGIMSNCSFNSVCVNRPGGFDCPCKRGMTGDGKRGTCTENFPPAAKAAVGLSSFIVFIVLIFMVKQHLKLKKFYEQNGGPVLKGVRNIKIYTKKELKQITSNYSSDIGEGASGKVYMGTLKGGQQVAIKKSKKVDEERKSEFTQEVILQSEMKHKNIIQLFGCCLEVDVPMLVYEFTVKGSLHDVLFKCDENMKGNLHDIAIGSAEGLTYMHTARETPIRHGDLKSGNILIDNNFVPKISDFGTSRSLVAGHKFRPDKFIPADMNYIDPVYMEDGMLTEKSDIYSFGIVLIELVTRKPAKYDDDRSYVRNFIQAYLDKREREKCHKEITPDVEINILEMVSEVAVACLEPVQDKRPDMIEVERQLHRIRHIAGQRIEEKKEEFQRAFPRTGSVISNGFKASSLSGRVPVTKQRSLM
ncbi:Os10g0174548 [Oryza sativa Japonica Group]|uniref:Os10g0174548 protein n=1 Tax=Oryza sativa subsp. japonica TaxID=39947 RepID=A0A0P0XS43_ORYSJ|nr:Os10g0174548 [Oryza sativa Japonica Group]